MKSEKLRPNWYIVTAFLIVLFGFLINSPEIQSNQIDALFKFSSLNSWLFYNFNDPYYLEFEFNNIHPYFILISLAIKFLPGNIIILFLGILLFFLIYKTYAANQQGIKESVFLLSFVVILPVDNGILVLMWIQYLGLSLVKKHKPVYALFSSLLFLPGFFLVFLTDIVEKYFEKKSLKEIILKLKSYLWVFLSLLFFHLILALVFFNINFNDIIQYISLPVQSQFGKIRVNNLTHTEIIFLYYTQNKIFLAVLFFSIFAGYLTDKKETFLLKLLFSGFLFSVIALLLPFSQGFWIVFSILLFLSGSGFNNINKQKQIYLIAGILVILLIHFIGSFGESKFKASVDGENIVISFKDFNEVKFEIDRIKKITIVDLKIIPDNARLLMEDTKSGKIEPVLNIYTVRFLEKELAYGEKIIAQIKNNPRQYVICLKSRIHPESESPPLRRVVYIWNIIKSNTNRVFLF
jgi:hypothetical protein